MSDGCLVVFCDVWNFCPKRSACMVTTGSKCGSVNLGKLNVSYIFGFNINILGRLQINNFNIFALRSSNSCMSN